MPAGFVLIAGAADVARGRATWRGRVLALALAAPPPVLRLIATRHRGRDRRGRLGIVAATALGMPIFAALGGGRAACSGAQACRPAPCPGEIYRLAPRPCCPRIPLFTLGGYIFSEGGASRRLMRILTALVGWMPGGLAIVTTLLLAFFTPFTGASGVTILSMGGLLLPMLVKAGYPENTSLGLVTVSGSIGLLFPPSLPVILYGI